MKKILFNAIVDTPTHKYQPNVPYRFGDIEADAWVEKGLARFADGEMETASVDPPMETATEFETAQPKRKRGRPRKADLPERLQEEAATDDT